MAVIKRERREKSAFTCASQNNIGGKSEVKKSSVAQQSLCLFRKNHFYHSMNLTIFNVWLAWNNLQAILRFRYIFVSNSL